MTFPESAQAWLERDPVANTVPLTVIARLRLGLPAPGMLLGWVTDGDGSVAGVAVHTPPYPLVLAGVPDGAVGPLVAALGGREVRGVNGPLKRAEEFAEAWHLPETGRMSMRLYRLDTLRAPGVAGTARVAGPADLDLLVAWYRAFFEESEPANAGVDPTEDVRQRIGNGELRVWEDGGRPASLAAFSTPIAGMSRIGPVYTPPDARRHGYGSAVTHAVSQAALDAGARRVLLFTDLANPTSNAIYQALGYRPVNDYAAIEF